jgi:hypothetical protein
LSASYSAAQRKSFYFKFLSNLKSMTLAEASETASIKSRQHMMIFYFKQVRKVSHVLMFFHVSIENRIIVGTPQHPIYLGPNSHGKVYQNTGT